MSKGNKASIQPAAIPDRIERLHTFHGGIQLPGHRELTDNKPIRPALVPKQLVIPLQQHIGQPAICLVSPGEHVKKGQCIATATGAVSAPVHASSSGTVTAIEERPVPHPSGLSALCIIVETDGRDEWTDLTTNVNYRETDPNTLVETIHAAGITGLGGAGFPTQTKLKRGLENDIELLVINGTECEPWIACDNALLKERAHEVIQGTHILQHILKPRVCLIVIEDGMQAAETALQSAVAETGSNDIHVIGVPEIYPTGGERQLIKVLTGREVPSQGFPSDIGIVCQNVGTAAVIYNAVVLGQPLVSRIVTVTGAGVKSPQNMETLIGTPINELIEASGGVTDDLDRLLMGGPIMGFELPSDRMPVIKTTNCLLALTTADVPTAETEQACIRCGDCTTVCPADLLPQQLYWHARSSNHDKAQDYNLFDCIECGCCALVCPSHIPLVQYYRFAKTEIWAQERQKRTADIARQRHLAREQRLARIKQERTDQMARKKQALSSDTANKAAKQSAIEAALDRVRRKKEQNDVAPVNVDNLSAKHQQLIDEVDARRVHKSGQEGNGGP
jgi:electron transport complex protein RnfC